MSKRTLLLADDSVTIQKVVNLTFADEGIDVVTVGDGDSAMEKISQISPDVVLADVHMPGLSGYQICEILRQNPVTREMPVVLLVGSFEPFDEGEAARVGANAYLTKPFQSIRQLVSQVTDLMDASARASKPEIAEQEPAIGKEESAIAEPQPIEKEVDDIESLYHRSFAEPSPAGVEGEAGAAPRYVDAGMDDEMIETSFGDRTDYQTPGTSSEFSSDEGDRSPEFASQTELAESGEASYSESEPVFDFAETYRTEQIQEFASFVDEGGDFAVAAAGDSEPAFDEFSSTDPSLETAASTTNQFETDETEILELPPIDNGKTLEFTTTQRMRAETMAKELVSLSPELMDMLVQKVVDKLSEK
ncbi:MAG: response regulator [Acidobacteriota bacterium]